MKRIKPFDYLVALEAFMTMKGVKTIYFDFKSYDCDEDIPQFIWNGVKYYIYSFKRYYNVYIITACDEKGEMYEFHWGNYTKTFDKLVSVKDGSEESFAYELFNNGYNEICDAEDEDQDDFLEAITKSKKYRVTMKGSVHIFGKAIDVETTYEFKAKSYQEASEFVNNEIRNGAYVGWSDYPIVKIL